MFFLTSTSSLVSSVIKTAEDSIWIMTWTVWCAGMQSLLENMIFQGLKEVKVQKCLLWQILFQKVAHLYMQLYSIMTGKEDGLCSVMLGIF